MLHLETRPIYADSADVAEARISWRQMPLATADRGVLTARLSELDTAIAEVSKQAQETRKRHTELAEVVSTGETKTETLKLDAIAGRCSIDDVVSAKARIDVAREILPTLSATVAELQTQERDHQAAHSRTYRELRDLEAMVTWHDLQAALIPAQAAIAAWFATTGDSGLLINNPKSDD